MRRRGRTIDRASGRGGGAVIISVLLLSAVAAFGEATVDKTTAASSNTTVKVRSDGCAPGTTPSSRDAAVLEARRNSVMLWLSLELGEDPGDEFSPLLDYLDNYTATYRLLGVNSEDGQTCVDLDVYLYEWPLRADTAALLFRLRASPPKVVFLFVERDDTDNSRKFQADTRVAKLFTDYFSEKGFAMISPLVGTQAYSDRELLSIAQGGDAALARYGAELGADTVVAVEVALSAGPVENSNSGLRARAEVTTRAVSTATGRLHDRSLGTAETDCANAASGFGFALPDAVYKVRDAAVVGSILAARAGGGGTQMRMTVEGLGDFVTAQRVAAFLGTIQGVSDAAVMSVRANTSLISFSYDGRMGELVDALEAGQSGLPALSAQRVTGNDMVMRAEPANPR